MKITIEVTEAIQDAIRLNIESLERNTVEIDRPHYLKALSALESERNNAELKREAQDFIQMLCEDYAGSRGVSCPVYDPQLTELKELTELAAAVCKTACGTYNDRRSSVDREKLKKLSSFLFS